MPTTESKTIQEKVTAKFLSVDTKTNWLWFQEEISYLFISPDRVTEVKIIPTINNSFNVWARIDLKDRLEYKLIDTRKTLAAAKKLSEDFVLMLKTGTIPQKKKEESEKIETVEKSETIKKKISDIETKNLDTDSLSDLIALMEELKN
ncbi:MAG TPA: hypothetical protein PLL26_03750 [Candidatus Dojkabacteria bacterium]|nr:hypothetical protein [Candidatus Dojkabacteria bacterium]